MNKLKFLLRCLTLGAGLTLGLPPAQATLIRGPMLQGATTTNIYVTAEGTVNATSPLTVNYGTTTAYGAAASTASVANSSASPVTYVHRIKLTGLQPNTLYHYQLSGQGTNLPDYTFRTLATSGTPFRFAWTADYRNSSDAGVHGQIATRVRTQHNSPQPPLFDLTGGDYAGDNTYANWTSQWLVASELEKQKGMASYYSPGNHDGWAAGSNMQNYSQPPDSTGTSGYYSFDCGDLHVTVGNYQTTYALGSAQYNWMQQDLTNSLKAWKIFAFHAPAFTYGGGANGNGTPHAGDPTMQAVHTNLLQPNGVKVFLAGHNHFYQRVLMNGIQHITCGAAGAPLYAVGSGPGTQVSFSDNCYLIGDVSPTNLHLVVYNNVGTVLDTIDLKKPAAPAAITAAAGNTQATLNWSSVAGATNYTLYYGTVSGGPYPNKKSTPATNITVTGLVNGTACYFVAVASDTNGASAISPQAMVTPIPPPAIILTTPANGGTFQAPATISLAATVTTNGNTINQVQFYYAGASLIGEDATAPYVYPWTNVSAGSYSVTARLIYNGSSTLDSAPANLTVTNLPPVFTRFAVQTNGTFTATGSGAARQAYVLWEAANLTSPVAWQPVATNTADDSGQVIFSNPTVTDYPQRYYRLGTP